MRIDKEELWIILTEKDILLCAAVDYDDKKRIDPLSIQNCIQK